MKIVSNSILLLLMPILLWGQETNLQKAFQESYALEYKKEYTEAAKRLLAVYSSGSYELNLRLGWLQYLQGEYDQAIAYYQKAVELMPYSVEARLGWVLPLAELGNWNQVVNIYESTLAFDPGNAKINYRLGSIYYSRGNYDKALRYTEQAVNMYPFDFDAVILLAWINLKREDYRKAKVLFNKSLLINPQNKSALAGLELIK